MANAILNFHFDCWHPSLRGRPSSRLPRFAPGWEHSFSFQPPQQHRGQWFPACPIRVELEFLLQPQKGHVSGVRWSRPAQTRSFSAAHSSPSADPAPSLWRRPSGGSENGDLQINMYKLYKCIDLCRNIYLFNW